MADEWGDGSFAGMMVLDKWRNPDGTLTVTEEHFFNRFKKDVLDVTRFTIHKLTGRTRPARKGDLCWTEIEYQDVGMLQKRVAILQKTKIFSRNQTLTDYYNLVSGYDAGVPFAVAGSAVPATQVVSSGATVIATSSAAYGSGLAPVMSGVATGASATGVVAGLAAFGYGIFYIGTWYSQTYSNPPDRQEGEGWRIVMIILDPPEKEWEGTPYWVQASPKKPCSETGMVDPGHGHGEGHSHGGIGDGVSRSLRRQAPRRVRSRARRRN